MLGAGIWGAGWVAGQHAEAYEANPNSRVVAIGSSSKAKAQAKADAWGISCPVYDDLDEMLKQQDLDVVSICTTHDMHVNDLVRVAEAEKHALVEKPLAMDMAGVRRAREVVKRTGIKTLLGYVLRWNPYVQMLHNLVDDGTLGNLVYIECGYFSEQGDWWPGFKWGITKEKGGSVILLGAGHAIDCMLGFAGEVDEVFAYQTRRNRQDYEYEPTIAGVLKFKNGIVGVLGSSFEVHAPYVFPIILGGSKGSVRDGKIHADRFKGQTDWITLPSILPDSPQVSHHPFKGEINHFIDCILKDEESFLNVERASLASEVGFALERSAETGRPVKLPLEE